MAEFIMEMQQFSKLSDQERATLKNLEPFLKETADNLAETFYDNLLAFEGTAKHFASNPERVGSLKNQLKVWYIGLAKGSYDNQYANDRYRIGYRSVTDMSRELFNSLLRSAD
jgi:hypothetical protein